MIISKWDRTDAHVVKVWGRGRCFNEYKPLLSSFCKNSCKYCFFRKERAVERHKFSPEKLAKFVYYLWLRGKIDGVMISSGVFTDPEIVVEEEIEAARLLRKMGFRGFIHLRLMPGTPKYLVWEAARIADRIGVNIESPDKTVFYEIAPDKGSYRNDLMKVLENCYRAWRTLRREGFLKSGIVTQMIVGLGESDLRALETTEYLIRNFKLRRVYYSPFEPIKNTPLEDHSPCPVSRARRLYQVFFLLKDYGFMLRELKYLFDENDMLPAVRDIKFEYAKRVLGYRSIDLNSASFNELVKVPGIGPVSAKRILRLREQKRIDFIDLRKILGPSRFKKAAKFVEV